MIEKYNLPEGFISERASKAIDKIKNGTWREEIDKQSIAFTEDGKILDYNSDLIGKYKLSLDCKRLIISILDKQEETWNIVSLSKYELEVDCFGLVMTFETMK